MAKSIQFQDRDLAALTELGTVGIMSTEMIHERHFSPGESGRKYCQRRIRLYREHGLIESRQLELNLPWVQRLTPRGAHAIEEQTGFSPPRPAKSEIPLGSTLLHRLGVARTILAFSDSCRHNGLPAMQFLMEQDQIPGCQPTDHIHERFLLYEAFGHGPERVTCRPDASLLIQLPGDWNLCLYLEYDRATENEREISGKLPGYASLLHPTQRSYQRHWPTIAREFARVLFVVPRPLRGEQIAGWLRGEPGAEYVRIATETDLQPDRLLSEPIWQTITGEKKAILLPTDS